MDHLIFTFKEPMTFINGSRHEQEIKHEPCPENSGNQEEFPHLLASDFFAVLFCGDELISFVADFYFDHPPIAKRVIVNELGFAL